MYSLTIHFGPNAIMWQFLFKDKEKAYESFMRASQQVDKATHFSIADDFGQEGTFGYASVHGVLIEDIDLMEEARILRSLADARASAKLQSRARTDSVIRAAQTGAPVLTPIGGGFRQ